ncbi:hypothetical protein JZ751_010941 [Albula glossodonta]|uniref:Uncharacterized protein n=1 Tax=Albula glossodonta TaxID=121402 RepID=A0A8T2P3R9_9TELE|nr:hypothetical protein JZ751_010941 [Albula glossodonta]
MWSYSSRTPQIKPLCERYLTTILWMPFEQHAVPGQCHVVPQLWDGHWRGAVLPQADKGAHPIWAICTPLQEVAGGCQGWLVSPGVAFIPGPCIPGLHGLCTFKAGTEPSPLDFLHALLPEDIHLFFADQRPTCSSQDCNFCCCVLLNQRLSPGPLPAVLLPVHTHLA